jgi:hypothetical protein
MTRISRARGSFLGDSTQQQGFGVNRPGNQKANLGAKLAGEIISDTWEDGEARLVPLKNKHWEKRATEDLLVEQEG